MDERDLLRDLLLRASPLLPVLTVEEAETAPDLARALYQGGLSVLEVTLRTPTALESIRRIVAEVPEVVVAAGTVTRPGELVAAAEAGARFAVSPGLTPALARAAVDSPIPLLPGVATASEAMAARDLGWTLLKLFPAEAIGGRALLRALAGPLPELEFCPTGGIGANNYRDYLELPNVICVGGSWVAPRESVAQRDWKSVRDSARQVTT